MYTFPGGWNDTLNRRLDAALRNSAGKVHPPVLDVIAGNDSTTWVELFAVDGGHHWLVLDTKGDPIGNVTLPGNVRLRQVSRHSAWGQEFVDKDSANIVRYQIESPKPRAQSPPGALRRPEALSFRYLVSLGSRPGPWAPGSGRTLGSWALGLLGSSINASAD